MKVKVGQWVRTKKGNIYQIIKNHTLDIENYFYQCHINGKKEYGYIAKVADTPQGLVEGEDLIRKRLYINETQVKSIPLAVSGNIHNGKVLIYADMQEVRYEEIVEILTPNSKGDYIKQWEKE